MRMCNEPLPPPPPFPSDPLCHAVNLLCSSDLVTYVQLKRICIFFPRKTQVMVFHEGHMYQLHVKQVKMSHFFKARTSLTCFEHEL